MPVIAWMMCMTEGRCKLRYPSVLIRLVLAVLAYAIAAACATVDAANAALPAYVLTLQFFVGLLIRIADIPGNAASSRCCVRPLPSHLYLSATFCRQLARDVVQLIGDGTQS